jgi:hypothetical protein
MDIKGQILKELLEKILDSIQNHNPDNLDSFTKAYQRIKSVHPTL